mmetsp:Transcript_17864/g.58415  ORF Transcript_17864/g.58415 Transcript_17864/m.58415 type:complete len:288 (-) Transcript_17864:127-990(-)
MKACWIRRAASTLARPPTRRPLRPPLMRAGPAISHAVIRPAPRPRPPRRHQLRPHSPPRRSARCRRHGARVPWRRARPSRLRARRSSRRRGGRCSTMTTSHRMPSRWTWSLGGRCRAQLSMESRGTARASVARRPTPGITRRPGQPLARFRPYPPRLCPLSRRLPSPGPRPPPTPPPPPPRRATQPHKNCGCFRGGSGRRPRRSWRAARPTSHSSPPRCGSCATASPPSSSRSRRSESRYLLMDRKPSIKHICTHVYAHTWSDDGSLGHGYGQTAGGHSAVEHPFQK